MKIFTSLLALIPMLALGQGVKQQFFTTNSGAVVSNGVLVMATNVVGNNSVPPARTVTISGTANQVTSSAGAQDLSANRTWTLSTPQDIATASAVQFATVYLTGTSNYLAGTVRVDGGINSPTNMTAAPNMDRVSSLTNISANFTMAEPIGVDGGFTIAKQTLWQITNSSAVDKTVTAAANVHTYWWGTNVTAFHVTNYVPVWVTTYGKLTNAYVGPGY